MSCWIHELFTVEATDHTWESLVVFFLDQLILYFNLISNIYNFILHSKVYSKNHQHGHVLLERCVVHCGSQITYRGITYNFFLDYPISYILFNLFPHLTDWLIMADHPPTQINIITVGLTYNLDKDNVEMICQQVLVKLIC